MTLRAQRILAASGLVIQASVPVGIVLTVAGALKTFAEMNGDTAQAGAAITGGVATALKWTAIGRNVGLLGFGLFSLALFQQNLRERWI